MTIAPPGGGQLASSGSAAGRPAGLAAYTLVTVIRIPLFRSVIVSSFPVPSPRPRRGAQLAIAHVRHVVTCMPQRSQADVSVVHVTAQGTGTGVAVVGACYYLTAIDVRHSRRVHPDG